MINILGKALIVIVSGIGILFAVYKKQKHHKYIVVQGKKEESI